MTRLPCMAMLVALLSGAPAAAQTDPLHEVEELLMSGRFTPARTALDRWVEQNPPGAVNVSGEQRAHAMFLRGRLATDAADWEEAYRAVVLSYPSSGFASQAMLLLGQGFAARGENERAEAQLRRLVTDYPASAHRPTAMLWIARIQAESGDGPGACETVRQAMTTRGADRDVSALLRTEEEASCNRPAARRDDATAQTRNASQPERATGASPERRTAAPRASQPGAFTVQVAAVRNRQSAEALTARLRRLGFEARTTFIDGSDLARVRVGQFASAGQAATTARRLRDAGFEALVVDDVRREAQR